MTPDRRIALLDVNALVALAWDAHVHHFAMRHWFDGNAEFGWATCPVTESGFVRVSSNPVVLPAPISTEAARQVLAQLRSLPGHHFWTDRVSQCDLDLPSVTGHRQVTDAHLITLAQRNRGRLLTFDTGAADLDAVSAICLPSI